jgi:uncharacterized membrane protein YozB (DUF420 family)
MVNTFVDDLICVVFLTLVCLAPHGERDRRLVPNELILVVILLCVPSPKANKIITEDTPMIIPRLLSIVLSLFALTLLRALRICSRNDIERLYGLILNEP